MVTVLKYLTTNSVIEGVIASLFLFLIVTECNYFEIPLAGLIILFVIFLTVKNFQLIYIISIHKCNKEMLKINMENP